MRLRNIPEAKDIVENSPFVIQQPCRLRGNWKDVWHNDKPIHLEVGMGKGRFLMEMSLRHSENNYLGMELYDSVLLRAIQRRQAMEAESENLFFLCTDARMLPEIFAEDEIQKIYLNFSDPWPKERHAKRRLTSPLFLEIYDTVLDPNGTVCFKTDNRSLFDYSLETIKETSPWRVKDVTYDLHGSSFAAGNVMTEYEEKFSSKGMPIHRLVAYR